MKKNLYAICDTLSGFVLGLDFSASEPERYVLEQNRLNCMQPNAVAPTIVFKHVGVLDDETLDGELFKLPVTIGDLQDSIRKLEAFKNAKSATKPL